jgi:hypothetical protein
MNIALYVLSHKDLIHQIVPHLDTLFDLVNLKCCCKSIKNIIEAQMKCDKSTVHVNIYSLRNPGPGLAEAYGNQYFRSVRSLDENVTVEQKNVNNTWINHGYYNSLSHFDKRSNKDTYTNEIMVISLNEIICSIVLCLSICNDDKEKAFTKILSINMVNMNLFYRFYYRGKKTYEVEESSTAPYEIAGYLHGNEILTFLESIKGVWGRYYSFITKDLSIEKV